MSASRFTVAILACFICYFHLVSPLHAQSAAVQLWYITFQDVNDLNSLAASLDVWEVDHASQRLLAPLTTDEAELIGQDHHLELAADQSPLGPPQISASQVDGIPGYACYRTVNETYASLDQLALNYPQLVRKVDIGDSWDKENSGGPNGDDIRVLVISNKSVPGPKFRFMLMGAIHAREYATAELALRFAESLLQGYGTDADATWLLDHGELHLLTYANPDGRRIAETGELWRKNTHFESCVSYGVDLNRNSSFKWNGCDGINCSSSDSCNQTYRGESPASEPEVKSIQAYLRKIFPDRRGNDLEDAAATTTPGLFLSLHSYGRLVLFPWGWTAGFAPNAHGLATIARHIGFRLDYTVCQAGGFGCLYQTDGTSDDFSYGELGVPSFTVELGTSFFQSCSYFESDILEQGIAALRYAFAAAPRAYELSQGPEVLNVQAVPQVVSGGKMVAISATADAERMAPLGGFDVDAITEEVEPIQGARITVDDLPWAPAPVAYPLVAVDGNFNALQEDLEANLELGCFPSGRHSIYLQAQDDGGDWGIVSSALVTVTNASSFTATIASDQEIARFGKPIRYSVQLTNTGATTGTFDVETKMSAESVVEHSLPITLSAGSSLRFSVVVTPQNSTASEILPAVVLIRSIIHPTQCRQVQMATPLEVRAFRQRLPYIGNY